MLIKCLKQGIKNRNSVLSRVEKSAIFVLNRVRVWGAVPHFPTQGYIEYPPPGSNQTKLIRQMNLFYERERLYSWLNYSVWLVSCWRRPKNSSFGLSPPQRPLYVVKRLLCCGEAGEKEKESARGTMGRGKRDGRLPPFPSSHRPPRAFYFFDYWYFDGDAQREPLRRREWFGRCIPNWKV